MADQPNKSAAEQWNARFSSDAYVYGTEPNVFLAQEANRLPAHARILSLAEGEGRNGVFLASQGHSITGVDASSVGLEKARRLAAERGVELQTIVSDLGDYAIAPNAWDAVVLIFCHLPPPLRAKVFPQIVKGLKPGGLVILEAYTPDQLKHGTGGPPVPELLYTADGLRQEFAGLEFPVLQELERDVIEGTLHSGRAAVVQMVARKPA